jgi:hypothetical protein
MSLTRWEDEGTRLKDLADSANSPEELAEVLLSASGLSSADRVGELPTQLSWAAFAFANFVHRVDQRHWFSIIARYLRDATLEEIATTLDVSRQRISQILIRESEVVFAGGSELRPVPQSESFSSSGQGDQPTPWLDPGWIHRVSSLAGLAERRSAVKIFENLICASNSETPKGDESAWRPFAISGLVPSKELLENRRRPHDGYLVPHWVSVLKGRIPASDGLVYWHTSVRGPVPARAPGGLDLERPETLALLTWADLVHFDEFGPKSAVIMLRNEVDEEQLRLRLCAAVSTGRFIPIPILVVLPSTEKASELRWSSLDVEGIQLDENTIQHINAFSSEVEDKKIGTLHPSALQEVWHVHEGKLSEALNLAEADLRSNGPLDNFLWGRYRPQFNEGSIRFQRI